MSVRVMTAVWDIRLPDSEKIVLLALADCANDEGHCWPSMATLAKKCSKSDRTVQAAIKALCDAGHLTRTEVLGKGCNYTVHPRSDFTPEATSPPKRLHHTPEAASDKPSRTINNPPVPSEQSESAREPDHVGLIPEVVDAWQVTAERHGLPMLRGKLSPQRRKKLIALLREHPPDDWRDAFAAFDKSKFLRGETGNWRGATFDFLLQPSSFQRVIEGNYNDPSH